MSDTLCKICGKDLNRTTECAWTSCPKLFWDEDRMDTIGQNGNDALAYKEITDD
jgi:hypothetical protein